MMQSKPQQDVSSDGPFVEKLSRTCRDSEPLSYRVQRYRLGLDATPLGLGVTRRRFERFCCGWETSPHKGSHWVRPDGAGACSPSGMVKRLRELQTCNSAPGHWSEYAAGRTLYVRPAAIALFLHQRTLAGFERLGGIFRRDGGDGLVVVPGVFRLLGLFHLEQIGRNDPAAIDPQGALAEQRIVGREFLHLGDHLGAVMWIAAERFHGF